MFFEVHAHTESELRGSVYRNYSTKLSRTMSKRAIAVLSLKHFPKELPTWFLGWPIEFEENRSVSDVHVHRMYPFGIDVWKRSWYETGKNQLLWKWIWGVLEYLLLSQFSPDFSVSHDFSMTQKRREQLKKYWALRPMKLGRYLSAFSSTLRSPHFSIMKFPSWITDPEILQLWEKA